MRARTGLSGRVEDDRRRRTRADMTRVSSAAIARAIDIRRSGAGNRATSENIIGEKGE